MKRVIIESPYAGKTSAPWPLSIIFEWIDRRRNIAYLRDCLRDSLMRGEAPFASHAIYTQPGVLRDHLENEREHGIQAGFAWGDVAALRVFYTDRGISRGMEYGKARAKAIGQPIEMRSLPQWQRKPKTMPKLSAVTTMTKGDES